MKVLCPGVEHTVTVKYPEARRTLLTTTQGAWATANATCLGRMYTPKGGKSAESFTAVLTIPCNTTGEADSPAGRCRYTSRRTQCCWRITTRAAGRDELHTNGRRLAPFVTLRARVCRLLLCCLLVACAAASTILQVTSASSPSSAFKLTSMQVSVIHELPDVT